MIQYTPTPDYYNEYIQHGWLKDQAAKAHKYIERWRGKNGKWYYRYKSKVQNAFTKFNRNRLLKNWNSAYQDPGDRPRKRNADEITTNYGRKMLMRWDNGKPKSYWQKENNSNPIFNQKTLNAARKRAKKKQTTEKFKARMTKKVFPTVKGGYDKEYATSFRTNNKNGKNKKYRNPLAGSTRAQGYSSSIGSVDNNKATDHVFKKREEKERAATNKNRIMNQRKRKKNVRPANPSNKLKARGYAKTTAKRSKINNKNQATAEIRKRNYVARKMADDIESGRREYIPSYRSSSKNAYYNLSKNVTAKYEGSKKTKHRKDVEASTWPTNTPTMFNQKIRYTSKERLDSELKKRKARRNKKKK